MKLSTIDAFCQQLVKEQFQQLGISSRFRLGEERELNQMAQDCLAQMLEQRCKEQDSAYGLLAEVLAQDGERRLEQAVEQLWDFLDSYPFPEVQLSAMLEQLKDPGSPADSPWGKALLPLLAHRAGALAQSLEELQPMLEDDALFGPASVNNYHALLAGAQKLAKALEEGDWEQGVLLLRNLKAGQCRPRQKPEDRFPGADASPGTAQTASLRARRAAKAALLHRGRISGRFGLASSPDGGLRGAVPGLHPAAGSGKGKGPGLLLLRPDPDGGAAAGGPGRGRLCEN